MFACVMRCGVLDYLQAYTRKMRTPKAKHSKLKHNRPSKLRRLARALGVKYQVGKCAANWKLRGEPRFATIIEPCAVFHLQQLAAGGRYHVLLSETNQRDDKRAVKMLSESKFIGQPTISRHWVKQRQENQSALNHKQIICPIIGRFIYMP